MRITVLSQSFLNLKNVLIKSYRIFLPLQSLTDEIHKKGTTHSVLIHHMNEGGIGIVGAGPGARALLRRHQKWGGRGAILVGEGGWCLTAQASSDLQGLQTYGFRKVGLKKGRLTVHSPAMPFPACPHLGVLLCSLRNP